MYTTSIVVDNPRAQLKYWERQRRELFEALRKCYEILAVKPNLGQCGIYTSAYYAMKQDCAILNDIGYIVSFRSCGPERNSCFVSLISLIHF